MTSVQESLRSMKTVQAIVNVGVTKPDAVHGGSEVKSQASIKATTQKTLPFCLLQSNQESCIITERARYRYLCSILWYRMIKIK
jgi:hypothetical protein